MTRMFLQVAAAALWSLAASAGAASLPTWEGWIVGGPCAEERRIADCPLRHIDQPVLLLASGEVRTFRYGDGSGIRQVDVDKGYGKKVRLTGEAPDGTIESVRFDLLEKTGERKFFKGCL
ncbi:hypothetical protein [Thiohalomonas denitrificans]|uniref:Uncharacterized protein n=1 Tax=Thiohalomonas denitrificans TaxID=415747 RepID=A0A1G5Q9I7_9GAMM|nr:hypothetical protein [Thiohalomonas denitrificans]SCZ58357.1 hypothetical protein SAMN03097708_01672 [Thiohalomonas denitrificans]